MTQRSSLNQDGACPLQQHDIALTDPPLYQAFRPGVVDLTEDQLTVSRNAITLPISNLDLNILLPDLNW